SAPRITAGGFTLSPRPSKRVSSFNHSSKSSTGSRKGPVGGRGNPPPGVNGDGPGGEATKAGGEAFEDFLLTLPARGGEDPGLPRKEGARYAVGCFAREYEVVKDVLDTPAPGVLLLRLHPADHFAVLVGCDRRRPRVALAFERFRHPRVTALGEPVAVVPG